MNMQYHDKICHERRMVAGRVTNSESPPGSSWTGCTTPSAIVLDIIIKDSSTTAVSLNDEFLNLPLIRTNEVKVVGFIADVLKLPTILRHRAQQEVGSWSPKSSQSQRDRGRLWHAHGEPCHRYDSQRSGQLCESWGILQKAVAIRTYCCMCPSGR